MIHDRDDVHAPCRAEILRAYERAVGTARIQAVYRHRPDGTHELLKIERVDAFEDGLRIVVR